MSELYNINTQPRDAIISEIRQLTEIFMGNINRCSIDYEVQYRNDEKDTLGTFGKDYRLNWSEIERNSISFVVFHRKNQQVKFASNFFLYGEEDFDKTHFWVHDQKLSRLRRIPLAEIIGKTSFYGLTIGYTQSLKVTANFYKIASEFLNLVRQFAAIPGLLVFIECTGIENLDDDLRNQPEILLKPMKNRIFFEHLGVTKPQSITAEKLCRHLGFYSVDIYNLRTLGTVYFNKDVRIPVG